MLSYSLIMSSNIDFVAFVCLNRSSWWGSIHKFVKIEVQSEYSLNVLSTIFWCKVSKHCQYLEILCL